MTDQSYNKRLLSTQVVVQCSVTYGREQVLSKVTREERFALAQLCNKVPIGYNGTPSPPKLPSSLRRSPPHLIQPSLDRSHSPPQTASGSSQPFSTAHFPDTHVQT